MRLLFPCALLLTSACSAPRFVDTADAGVTDSPGTGDAGHDAGTEHGDSSTWPEPEGDAGCAGESCAPKGPCDVDHGGCDPLVSCSDDGEEAVCGACPKNFSDNSKGGCVPLLSALAPSIGVLSPAFHPRTFSYELELGLDTTGIAFRASAAEAVHIKVENQSVGSDELSNDMPVPIIEPRGVAVNVAAENGLGQSYAVQVTRAPRIHRRLAADKRYQFDDFGGALAIDGDTVVVGAAGNSSDGAGIDGPDNHDGSQSSGAVYVYHQVDGALEPEAFIKAAYPSQFGVFGVSVALSGDLLAVGAANENSCAKGVDGDEEDVGCPFSGAVFLFRRSQGKWAREAYLKASNTDASDNFGISVALSGDTLVVGARNEASGSGGPDHEGAQDDNSMASAGAVYVFRKREAGWEQEAYLKPHAALGAYRFGEKLDLEGDLLAVGAPGDDGMGMPLAVAPLANSGAIYLFQRTGDSWSETQQLRAGQPGEDDELGNALVLRGNLLAAGAWGEDSPPEHVGEANDDVQNSGAVYLFERKSGSFAPLGVTKSQGVQEGAGFGAAVALCDARTLFVGSNGSDWEAKGEGPTGYLVSTEPPFDVLALVESRNPEPSSGFGTSADCRPDTLMVGAYSENGIGAAYVIR